MSEDNKPMTEKEAASEIAKVIRERFEQLEDRIKILEGEITVNISIDMSREMLILENRSGRRLEVSIAEEKPEPITPMLGSSPENSAPVFPAPVRIPEDRKGVELAPKSPSTPSEAALDVQVSDETKKRLGIKE